MKKPHHISHTKDVLFQPCYIQNVLWLELWGWNLVQNLLVQEYIIAPHCTICVRNNNNNNMCTPYNMSTRNLTTPPKNSHLRLDFSSSSPNSGVNKEKSLRPAVKKLYKAVTVNVFRPNPQRHQCLSIIKLRKDSDSASSPRAFPWPLQATSQERKHHPDALILTLSQGITDYGAETCSRCHPWCLRWENAN